jgi:hypothetical protein
MTGSIWRPKHLLAVVLTAVAAALFLLHPAGLHSVTAMAAPDGGDCWVSPTQQAQGYCCHCYDPLDPSEPFLCIKVFGSGEHVGCSTQWRECSKEGCTPA